MASGGNRRAPRGEAVEDLTLALGSYVGRFASRFALRDVRHDARPLVEELQDLVVELVDALAMVVEGHGGAD